MQVIVAAAQEGARARLADALRAVALPGIAVAGAEPGGAGTGQLGAIALFQWGPVLLDAGDWPALESGARTLASTLSAGGLQVLPPCMVRVLEPGDLPSASTEAGSPSPAEEGLSAAYGTAPVRAARRAAALSPEHLSEVIIDLARERYGMQRWSTADLLWTLDLLRLPRQAIDAISDASLVSLGFVHSRVPLLDGKPHPSEPAPPAASSTGAPPVGAPPVGSPPVAVPPPVGSPPVGAPPVGAPSMGAPSMGAPSGGSPSGGSLSGGSPPPAAVPPAPAPAEAAEAPPLAPAPFPARELVVPPEAPTALISAVGDHPAPSEPAVPSRRLSGYSVFDDRDDDVPARRFPLWPIAAGVAAIVVIACVVIFLKLGGGSGNKASGDGGSGSAPPGTSAPPSASPTPTGSASPPPALSVPAGYTGAAADTQTDCASHSYGQTASFFQSSPCVRVQRQLLTATTGGHPTVYAVRDVTMPDAATAASLKALVDSSGTGNVNDLMREGTVYPGGPASLPSDTAYASAIKGARVRIVEAAPTDGTSVDDVPAVETAADALAATW